MMALSLSSARSAMPKQSVRKIADKQFKDISDDLPPDVVDR
jgi:hypothetical protein